jgi:hypothetical protein
MTAQEHWKRPGLVDDLNSAIRDNPVAAGLITAGALWMLFGRKGIGAAAAGIGAAAAGAGHMAGKAGSAAFGSARSATQTVAEAVGSAGSSVAATVANAGARGIDKVASIVPDLSADEPSDYGFTPEQSRARTGKSFAASATGRYAANVKSTRSAWRSALPLLRASPRPRSSPNGSASKARPRARRSPRLQRTRPSAPGRLARMRRKSRT